MVQDAKPIQFKLLRYAVVPFHQGDLLSPLFLIPKDSSSRHQ